MSSGPSSGPGVAQPLGHDLADAPTHNAEVIGVLARVLRAVLLLVRLGTGVGER